MSSSARVVLLTLLGVQQASAHSWVACTDYKVRDPMASPKGPSETDPARKTYDDALCSGYARGWQPFAAPFASDTGYNYLATDSAMCRSPPKGASDYSAAFPMATYSPGQTVCVAYPAKNHAAAPCTNAFIPDTDFAIYRSGVNPSSDPDWNGFQEHSLPHHNGVHQDGVIDYKGFQNCPDFCGAAGTDHATCSVCFDLEDNLAPGKYTFLWYWEFNPGSRYTSCWEAEVVGGGSSRPGPSPTPKLPAPTPKAPTPTPPAPGPKPVPQPGDGGGSGGVKEGKDQCFCPCKCAEGCWRRCDCDNRKAHTKDPFAGMGGGSGGGGGGGKPGPAPAPKPTPSGASGGGECQNHFMQCGGKLYSGSTDCCGSFKCTVLNEYYSQCL